MTDTVVITGIARTPMGAFKGAFADVAAPDLGAVAIKAAMSEALSLIHISEPTRP